MAAAVSRSVLQMSTPRANLNSTNPSSSVHQRNFSGGYYMSDKYALGHSSNELRRLATQASLIDPVTSRFFQAAGLVTGMRVLEIGSGAGDVAMLVSRIIGKDGEVVGTDKSETAIAVARSRVKKSGIRNVSFIEGDPADMKFEQPFDAVVGRYILQFLPDPASSLTKISRHLRPEGILVFHELDWDGARSSPRCQAITYAARGVLKRSDVLEQKQEWA